MSAIGSLSKRLKTPENVDELTTLYQENGLKYYLPMEEALNVATHALGAVFGVVGAVFMLLKATTPSSYAAAVMCSIGFILLYSVSTAYHACNVVKIKSVLRKLDYSTINFIVISCGTGICLLYDNVFGYVAYALVFAVAASTAFLCVYNFKKFRMYAFSSNFIVGGLLFATYFIVRPEVPTAFLLLNLFGIISVLIGAALFGVKKRYIHTVFHVFVLVGPVLFWAANYLLLS